VILTDIVVAGCARVARLSRKDIRMLTRFAGESQGIAGDPGPLPAAAKYSET
jgi:hypothetical protein